ncbi:MAG: DUF3800 domain-containing protein [Verrucomicrobiales bacterium]|nr:DUF3800 domain-containing protein [Verrucomicrobiales bacterium]
MYFFYFDETGTRDVTPREGNHLYVLTAVSLYEKHWNAFDQELTDFKRELAGKIAAERHITLQPADCEIKSHSLRRSLTEGKNGYNKFVHHLAEHQKAAIAKLYYSQLNKHRMRVFATIIDKRKLRSGTDGETMHRIAYEYALERITRYLREYQPKHNGVIVMDNTQTKLNRLIAAKHAELQRHGNANLVFNRIIEYPFFTDSKLSNGIQLADLCGYNIFRAFRNLDFGYQPFHDIIPNLHSARQSAEHKLDGLKIWPEDSPFIAAWNLHLKANPPARADGF